MAQAPDDETRKAAERDRFAQAERLIDLFEDVHGRRAISARELVDWAASPEGLAAIACDSHRNRRIVH
jgi:hypothetical protein